MSFHFLLIVLREGVFESSNLVDFVQVNTFRLEDTDRLALWSLPDFLVQGGFFAMFKIGERLRFELNFRLFDQELRFSHHLYSLVGLLLIVLFVKRLYFVEGFLQHLLEFEILVHDV